MSSIRRRAGARRPNNSGRILIPRLAAQVSSVSIQDAGTPGAKTIVELAVFGSSIRVIESLSPAVLSGVYFVSYVGGVAAANDADSITDGGPVAGGRLAVLSFPGEADLTRQWSLAWPSDSILIKSPRGSTLGGVIGPDQDVTAIPMGNLYFGPNDGGLLSLPVLWPVVSAVIGSGDYVTVAAATSGGTVYASPLAETIDVLISGSPYTVPVVAYGSADITLDCWAALPGVGQTFSFPAWSTAARGTNGEWFAPAELLLT